LSDKYRTRWGKRKPWYVMGFLFVIPCFMGIFAYPDFVNKRTDCGKEPIELCPVADETLQHVWYITLPALFNVGWASVQISHMSIVNTLSLSNRKRDKLSNNRNGFTFAANIVVLASALIMFIYVPVKIDQFRYLAYICLGLGAITSLFFIFTIGEIELGKRADSADMKYKKATMQTEQFNKYILEQEEKNNGLGEKKGKDWKDWLKEGSFYVHGMVYMAVRIAVNVTMTMQPFYLTQVTEFESTEENPTPYQLALVPLLSYITSLVFSLFF
jgi:Na+/melibiose symporter-like transporter